MIEIVNSRENNLKGINLELPKHKIIMFTGVSGSGKSSIVYDTLAQEAGRQLNETFNSFVRTFLPKYHKPKADLVKNLSTTIVIDQSKIGGNVRSTLGTTTEINSSLRVLFSRFGNGKLKYANNFSFNDPSGMCPACEGIGTKLQFKLDAVIDYDKSLNEGAILIEGYKVGSFSWKVYANSGFFDLDKKIKDYTPEEIDKLLYAQNIKVKAEYKGTEFNVSYEGLETAFMRANVNNAKETTKKREEVIKKYTKQSACPECEGKRYNPAVLATVIDGYNIFDLTDKEVDDLLLIMSKLEVIGGEILIESIVNKLQALSDIGLGYVTLTRATTTLSGGESQRVKMVKHLNNSLVDLVYIFDEPSIGLHPADVGRLNKILRQIRDKGNTVIIVEHDPDVIKIADYVVDVGPKAGIHGGEITYTGDYENLLKSDTLTGKYLKVAQPIKMNPRPTTTFIESSKSNLHNLKNVSLKIPENIFTVVTGVAGSGKSTLVNQVFAKEIENIIAIDQNPLHTNKRSNPATFTGISDKIRKLFAKENDVKPGLFSHNSDGGCEKCKGNGAIELNMAFMENITIECDVCHGKRYKDEVLEYRYNNKNIVEVLALTFEEAAEFFKDKSILKIVNALNEVGLGYMTLGQPLTTLSGGEIQRLKLALELQNKGNIYILDEPTTGLHTSDIKLIVDIINSLVDKGNTVIAIEHNVEVIKNADYIIDIGPAGGHDGGEIIYEGRIDGILNSDRSVTAQFLK